MLCHHAAAAAPAIAPVAVVHDDDDDTPIIAPRKPAPAPASHDDDDDAPIQRARHVVDDDDVRRLARAPRGHVTPLLAVAAAKALIALHLPEPRPEFRLNGLLSRSRGQVFFRRDTERPSRIELATRALPLLDGKDVRDELLHQIAHALTGRYARHGPAWQEAARRIGGPAHDRFCREQADYRERRALVVSALRCANGHVRCTAPRRQPQWAYFVGLPCRVCKAPVAIYRIPAPAPAPAP